MTEAVNSKPVESVAEGTHFSWSQAIARMGPGFAYVLTVLGTGDLIANSTAGASYGYALIWILALGLVFRFVWVNVSAKYILVTGESPDRRLCSSRPVGALVDPDQCDGTHASVQHVRGWS